VSIRANRITEIEVLVSGMTSTFWAAITGVVAILGTLFTVGNFFSSLSSEIKLLRQSVDNLNTRIADINAASIKRFDDIEARLRSLELHKP